MTELATEMPRCFSISIQSDVAKRLALRARTVPAIWIAPENSSSFSVSVVLPASGCEMIANERLRLTSFAIEPLAIFLHSCCVYRYVRGSADAGAYRSRIPRLLRETGHFNTRMQSAG